MLFEWYWRGQEQEEGIQVACKIERRFRIKLVLYDTLIYFVFLWFDMAFSAFWLLYVGMAFTLIYTIFTFTHIRAVRVGRR